MKLFRKSNMKMVISIREQDSLKQGLEQDSSRGAQGSGGALGRHEPARDQQRKNQEIMVREGRNNLCEQGPLKVCPRAAKMAH